MAPEELNPSAPPGLGVQRRITQSITNLLSHQIKPACQSLAGCSPEEDRSATANLRRSYTQYKQPLAPGSLRLAASAAIRDMSAILKPVLLTTRGVHDSSVVRRCLTAVSQPLQV